MWVDHRVADRVKFAFSHRLTVVGAFLTLLEHGIFRRFFVRLAGDEHVDAVGVQSERFVIRRRHIFVGQNNPGAIRNERHGLRSKLLAGWNRWWRRWWRWRRRCGHGWCRGRRRSS